MNTFGEAVKYIRKKKGFTVKQLSELSGISIRQINRVEKHDITKGTVHTLISLSNVLSVDLIEYRAIFSDFKNFEEFEIYNKLRYFIEHNNTDEIKNIIDKINIENIYEREFSVYKQIVLYSVSIITVECENNYNKAISLCYKAINTTQSNFDMNLLKNYLNTNISYVILGQIEYYNFKMRRYEFSENLSNLLINIIENRYYNCDLPKINIPNVILRTYIAMLNNKADNLFIKQEYNISLEYCFKAINELNRKKLNYENYMILFLICENYYKLDNIEEAQIFLNKSIINCINSENFNYINEKIKPKVEENYPLLNINTVIEFIKTTL